MTSHVGRANENRSGDAPPARTSRASLPGGLAESRRIVRRRGGLAAIAAAAVILAGGRMIGWLLGGNAGAAVSFASMVMAVPAMPVFGVPAAGGPLRLLAALASSCALWWFLGQITAGRISKRPVVGWREWTREFVVVGLGVWLGAVGGLVLAAVLLGLV